MKLPNQSALRAIAHRHLGDSPVRAMVRCAAMHTQAGRLFECGFEKHIARYSPAERLLLATMLPAYQAFVLIHGVQADGGPELAAEVDALLPKAVAK